jgi:hypothetical protein
MLIATVEDHEQADPGDPAVLVEQPRDQRRRHAHQHDGEGEADDQDVGMVLRRAGHSQHVVEAHRHVGDEDLRDRLAQRLLRRAGHALAGDRVDALALLGRLMAVRAAVAQLAVHLPADPEQQHAAGQHDADDRQQLDGDGGEADAHQRRGRDAPDDRLAPLVGRQARRGHADDDGVVARQHDVDEENLAERDELVGSK